MGDSTPSRVQSALFGAWLACCILCMVVSVTYFGPLLPLLVAAIVVSEPERKHVKETAFLAAFIAAGSIYIGAQSVQQDVAKSAYLMHRELIGCAEADRWNAFGSSQGFSGPVPSPSDAARCNEADDAAEFAFRMKERGW